MTQFRWLIPGMHVKRWLLLLVISFAALGLGFAVILQDYYQYHDFRWPWLIGLLSLSYLPHHHTIKANSCCPQEAKQVLRVLLRVSLPTRE